MRTNTPSAKQAILFHPLVWGAVVVYFANEFVLQRWMPSQITGKVSDFAWLFFAPIVVYVFIDSVVLPQSTFKWGDVFVWGGIGFGFVLLKISPVANHIVSEAIGYLLGAPATIALDPADTIAVIALGASFVFFRSREWPRKRLPKPVLLVAIGVVTLLTLADAAAPDYGIACLTVNDDGVVASSVYASYLSQDGGETWRGYKGSDERCWYDVEDKNAPRLLEGDGVYVLFSPGKPIQISTDAKSWKVEYVFTPTTEAQRAYYMKYHSGSPVILQGPLDAVVDPVTGNIIFAMGHEGVLVRKSDKEWRWVAVGGYQRIVYQDIRWYQMLGGEFVLALAAGLLSLVGLGRQAARDQRSKWKRVGIVALVVFAWMLLVFSMFLLPPAMTYGYSSPLSDFVAVLTALVTVVASILVLGKKQGMRRELVFFGLVSAALFFTPYMLWVKNVLRSYSTAAFLAFFSLIGGTMWRYWKERDAAPRF